MRYGGSGVIFGGLGLLRVREQGVPRWRLGAHGLAALHDRGPDVSIARVPALSSAAD